MLKFLKRPAESSEPQTEAKAAKTDGGGAASGEAPASSSSTAAPAATVPTPLPELPALAMLEHLDAQSPWRTALAKEFSKSYMRELDAKITQEREKKKVFPKPQDVFACLNFSPITDVRVVILGQDPYHGPGQAHGFCFSVNYGIAIPPSLKNIYTELQSDVPGFERPSHGNLTCWARQGVLLLNASLTVRQGEANSHANFGWQVAPATRPNSRCRAH